MNLLLQFLCQILFVQQQQVLHQVLLNSVELPPVDLAHGMLSRLSFVDLRESFQACVSGSKR